MEIQEITKKAIDEILCGLGKEIMDEAIGVVKGIRSKNSKWKKLFPDQAKSPWIRESLKPNQYFLLYPKNYGPYRFRLDNVKKSCFIIMGKIHEKNCEKTFVDGDYFEIPPGYDYMPYTTDKICMALVETDMSGIEPNLN